jgi:hypothetical protein
LREWVKFSWKNDKFEQFVFQVWFQNRRMKDKRQRMSLAWPYTDPHFAAYMFNLATSNSFQRYASCVGPQSTTPFPMYGMYPSAPYRTPNQSNNFPLQYPFPSSRSDGFSHHSGPKNADSPPFSPANNGAGRWSPKVTSSADSPKIITSSGSAVCKEAVLVSPQRTPLFQALLGVSNAN